MELLFASGAMFHEAHNLSELRLYLGKGSEDGEREIQKGADRSRLCQFWWRCLAFADAVLERHHRGQRHISEDDSGWRRHPVWVIFPLLLTHQIQRMPLLLLEAHQTAASLTD